MTGPLDTTAIPVRIKGVRAKPSGSSVDLHARDAADALGIEIEPLEIELTGRRSDGSPSKCVICVPQAFPYLIMKLCAFGDRASNPDKEMGRHHALDLYRIVAMLTESEDKAARARAEQYAGDPMMKRAESIVKGMFEPTDGLGRIRLREHRLCPNKPDLDEFAREILRMLLPG